MENIKSRIMDASMKLMQSKDMNSITVREIAKEARVNVASVSYYFNGKAQLFHQLMERYWADMMSIYGSILADSDIDFDKAVRYGTAILNFELQSTGVLRSEQVMYQQYGIDEATNGRIKMQFQAVAYLVRQLKPDIAETMILPKVLSILSALTCPGFWSDLAMQFLTDMEEFKYNYVRIIIESI